MMKQYRKNVWSHVRDCQEQSRSLLTGIRAPVAQGQGLTAGEGVCGSSSGREGVRILLGLGFIWLYIFVKTFRAVCVMLAQFALCKS